MQYTIHYRNKRHIITRYAFSYTFIQGGKNINSFSNYQSITFIFLEIRRRLN